jgi:TrmH family RNA methyltransferase
MYYSISSPQNGQLKRWKKLLTKKGRQNQGNYLVEGLHLLQEAQKSQVKLASIIVEEGYQDAEHILSDFDEKVPVFQLSRSLFLQLAETEQSQGIIAEVHMPDWDIEEQIAKSKCMLLLDEIQDPGNLGTILRTAAAAGVDCVLLGRGTVDVFNSKVVRSAMGALFRLPAMEADLMEWIPKLKERQIAVAGTSPHNGIYAFDYVFPDKAAIVLGNEGRGIQDAILTQIDQAIRLPMPGSAESYNVSVTTGMILYEYMRQQLTSS